MTSSARAALPPSKRPKKAAPGGKTVRSKSSAGKRAKTSVTNVAIATELAPAVAVALPDKTQQPPGAAAPALDCLAAGAVPPETDGKVRVQLVFENGTVLPVEMSNAAGLRSPRGWQRNSPSSELLLGNATAHPAVQPLPRRAD